MPPSHLDIEVLSADHQVHQSPDALTKNAARGPERATDRGFTDADIAALCLARRRANLP